MTVAENYSQLIANVNSNCDFNKFLKTITSDISTFVSSMVARVAGGFVTEIPNAYTKMKKANNPFVFCTQVGKLTALAFNYYI